MSNHSAPDIVISGSPASQSKAIDLLAPTSPPPSPAVSSSSADHIRFVYDICHAVSLEFIEDFHRDCAQVNPDEPSTELRRQGMELQRKYPPSLSIINNTRAICAILKLQSTIISTISGLPPKDVEKTILELQVAASFIRGAFESPDIDRIDSMLRDIYKVGRNFCDIMNRTDKAEEIFKYEMDAEAAKMEAKQEGPEVKQDETKQDEVKPNEIKQDEVKPDKVKPNEVKPDDTKQEENKQEETKQEEVKKGKRK